MDTQEMTLLAFTLCNSVRVVAYLPQIRCAVRDTCGCPGISCATWWMFLVSNLTVATYATINLADVLMAIIFSANAVCCVAILSIVHVKRRRGGRRPVTAAISQAAWT